jgi:hypothetical protein
MRDARFGVLPHLKKASPTASEALDGGGHVALSSVRIRRRTT